MKHLAMDDLGAARTDGECSASELEAAVATTPYSRQRWTVGRLDGHSVALSEGRCHLELWRSSPSPSPTLAVVTFLFGESRQIRRQYKFFAINSSPVQIHCQSN